MAQTDPNDDRRKYRKERERVREAVERGDIGTTEGDAIHSFGDMKKGSVATSTARYQLKDVRRCSEMANAKGYPPLLEWDKGEFETFTTALAAAEVPDRFLQHCGPSGWSAGKLRQYRNALKQFLLFLGRENDSRSWTDDDRREWVKDIELGAPPKPKVSASDLLSPDELTAMWAEIDSKRDAAIYALAYCSIQRNAVLRSFRIEDFEVHDGGTQGAVRIFENAQGRKGASGKKPVSWAVGPILDWLEVHPRRDELDAPLLCVNNDSGTADKGDPLASAESINVRLRKWAKRAGLDRDRWDRSRGRKERTIRTHLLRYTGAVRMAKSDEYSESTVKKWAGWTQSSDQLDRYLKLTDEDVLASWADAHDKATDVWSTSRPEFGTCERCQAPIEDWLPSCPACGHEPGDETPSPTGEAIIDDALSATLSRAANETDNDMKELISLAAQLDQLDDPRGVLETIEAINS